MIASAPRLVVGTVVCLLAGWGSQLPWGPPLAAAPQAPSADAGTAPTAYTKSEHVVPMRDGTRLYTVVYAPRACVKAGYPFMLQRTPYGAGPYGPDTARGTLGPSNHFQRDGFIFVYQDVRGRYLSEGIWEEVRPHVPRERKTAATVDESTDTWDTIDWLLKTIPCHNGRVGMWGVSYPGFYVSAGMIDAHPALRAVSPQAPVTDYFLGDDSFHNGAFMLAHNFSFYVRFPPRGAEPQPDAPPHVPFDYGTHDGYRFYLEAGPLGEMTRRYGLDANPYWMANLEHTTYDAFWQDRSIWRHFRDIAPAVLTVGGWYDAENLMGPLRTFASIARQSPATSNRLVMGPWTHGSWSSGDGSRVGPLDFGQNTAAFYRDSIEFPFFAQMLKGRPGDEMPTAWIFETGTNRWRAFDAWPPRRTRPTPYYFGDRGRLATSAAVAAGDAFDEYVSDPTQPVPLMGYPAAGMPADYMTADQRFAADRPDVLVYQTEALDRDVTVLGPIQVTLHVSTSGTDADFVVKVIDVHPGDPPGGRAQAEDVGSRHGYQQLVRGEPFRGKFRRSLEVPEPFVPNQPEVIRFELGDVAHTFRRGHRLMVHVQSSWFPLIDRNPQVFMHIPDANRADFVTATQRVYRGGTRLSSITLPVE
jgi:uncharacterized protein